MIYANCGCGCSYEIDREHGENIPLACVYCGAQWFEFSYDLNPTGRWVEVPLFTGNGVR